MTVTTTCSGQERFNWLGALSGSGASVVSQERQERARYTFTVFTATFNRAHTLDRVWRSLQAQTWTDFEWVIVDDGSTDGTDALVRSWMDASPFPICYEYQENQGKHAALNRGLNLARGAFFVFFDSDDECVPQALERLHGYWEAIPTLDRHRYAGLVAACMNPDGTVVGDPFPARFLDSTPLEMRYRYKVGGEKWTVVRTDIHRRFPFPMIEGYRGYLPESVVWDAIGREYLFRYVNDPLRIYHTDVPGITRGRVRAHNAAGEALESSILLNQDMRWFRHAPRAFFVEAVKYGYYASLDGRTWREQVQTLWTDKARLLWGAALPLALTYRVLTSYQKWEQARGAHHAAAKLVTHHRPVRFLVSRALMHSRLCRLVRIRRPGYRLHFSPTGLCADLWCNPDERAQDHDFVTRYLRDGETALDIGANVGSISVPAARTVGPRGQVIAIEPHPLTFARLERNLRLNGCTNVSPVQVALGDHSTRAYLTNLGRMDDQNQVSTSPTDIPVPMRTLDQVCAEIGTISLMKLDVEGYEKFVLSGAADTLRRTECLYFEAYGRLAARFGCRLEDIFDLLEGAGFTLLARQGERLCPIKQPPAADRCVNLIASRNVLELTQRTGFYLEAETARAARA